MIGNVYKLKSSLERLKGYQLVIIKQEGPFYILKEFGKEDKPGFIHKKTKKEIDRELVLIPKGTLRNNLIFGSK